MKVFAWLALLAAIACVSPVSANAFSLPLGTHKLEWVMPSAASKGSNQVSENGSLRLQSGLLAPIPHRIKIRIDGAKSAEVLATGIMPRCRSLVAVTDESKGTGKGYDSLYIVPFDPAKSDVIHIGQAKRINISAETSYPGSGRRGSLVIDLPFGEGANEITMPVEVDSASLTRGHGWMSNELTAIIKFRGKWIKSVTTNEGKFTITSIDCNGNGIFNEYTRNSDEVVWGDYNRSVVQIACTRKGSTKYWYMHAGMPKLIDGVFYVADLNDIGNEVRIKRYDGGIAKVKFRAVDGYGKPIAVSKALVNGPYGDYTLSDKKYVSVPSGDYHYYIDLAKPGTRPKNPMGVGSACMMNLPADKGTTIFVGGPVRVVPDPKVKEISYVQGAFKRIMLVPMMGYPNERTDFSSSGSNIKVTLKIKDCRGRVVWTERVVRSRELADLYAYMPTTLTPGTYRLFIKTDIAHYQDTITTERKVVVKPLTGSGPWALPAGKFERQCIETPEDYPTLPAEFATELRPVAPTEAARFTGQKLNKPYWGVQGRITIIVDSSRPDSNIFDTAYLVTDVPESGNIDLAEASKLGAISYIQTSPSGYAVPGTMISFMDTKIKMALGSGSDRAVKTVTYGLNVKMAEDGNFAHPDNAFLIRKEPWNYVISADSGDVTLSLADTNMNGVYNDEVKDFGYKADRIWVLDAFGGWRNGEPHLLGKILRFRDKYYEVKVSSLGDTIEIKPYTGPMGKLQIHFVDPKGKDSCLWPVDIATSDSLYTLNDVIRAVDVPVGEYAWNTTWFLGGSISTWGVDGLWYHIQSTRKVTVTEGQAATLKIGGPVAIELGPGVDSITAKVGGCTEISIATTIGDDNVSISGGIPFKITDALGNVIVESYLDILGLNDKERFPTTYALYLPSDMKAGEYKLTVSADTGDHQGVVSAEKKLVVE